MGCPPDLQQGSGCLIRRALGIATKEFEPCFHVSRYRLCLWESGQVEIDDRIMNEVLNLVERCFLAGRFPRQPIETGVSFLPARRVRSENVRAAE